MGKQINTVRGPIDVNDLGVTLTHEHLWMNCGELYWRAHGTKIPLRRDVKVSIENRSEILKDLQSVVFGYYDNLVFNDVDEQVREIEDFTACGGKTIVEVTTVDLDRNPLKLKEISEKSGVNVIMGGSYYWFPAIPQEKREAILKMGKEGLAEEMINEFRDGVCGTGIKPGVIGEVGNGDDEGSDIIYRASAIAQRETGVPMICHSPDVKIIDLVEKEGGDLSKLVMGHWGPTFPMEEAIKRGVWVSLDQIGMNFPGIESDDERINTITWFFDKGYEKQLLLSQDICWKVRLHQFGGTGYTDIFKSIFPKLEERGIKKERLTSLLVDNVKRLFS